MTEYPMKIYNKSTKVKAITHSTHNVNKFELKVKICFVRGSFQFCFPSCIIHYHSKIIKRISIF